MLNKRAWGRPTLLVGVAVSNRHAQLDSVIRRVDEILGSSKVPFSGLHRRVSQKELDLLQLAAGGTAHLRTTAPKVMGRDAWDARSRGVRPQ